MYSDANIIVVASVDLRVKIVFSEKENECGFVSNYVLHWMLKEQKIGIHKQNLSCF